MEFTRYSKICAKTVLKINWSVKTPWHKRMEVARYGLWVPVWLLHVWYFASTSDAMLLHFSCALISGYPSHNDRQYENRSKSHVRPFSHYCDARKKLVDRQPKLFKLTIAKQSFSWSHYSDNFSLSVGGLLAAFCFLEFGVTNWILCFDMVRNSGCCKYSFKIKLHEILVKVMGKDEKKRT